MSPLSCIAEDSVKDEGPQPLYKIGRINMICCVLHVHVCLWVRPLWFLILWEGLTVGGTTMLKHLTSIMRAHTHTQLNFYKGLFHPKSEVNLHGTS